ncbi:MAG: hypothetical protein AB1942_17700 [Pseudomonadota bacterium]
MASLADPVRRVLPAFRTGPHWDQESWDLLLACRDELVAYLTAMLAADFAAFRAGLMGDRFQTHRAELDAALAKYDVIAEQERLLGRALQPTIGVVLLWFTKPHAASVGGQRSLSSVDYPPETVVRIVAHEMLHPPFPMDGPAALNEDVVEALDQIVSERLGVARDPAERWAGADGGMHILAAAVYGMLKAEGYDKAGGNIERWIEAAATTGKLSPERIRTYAGEVTKTPPDQLWPRKTAS